MLVFASFVLFFLYPPYHLFLSPVLPVAAARAGVIPASLVIYSLLFVSSLVLGRAFCAWLCPGAALQEGCTHVVTRRASGRGYWVKYTIAGLWGAAVATTAVQAGGWKRIDFLFGTAHIGRYQGFWLAYGVFLIIPPMALLLGRWASCHYTCWVAPFLIAGNAVRARAPWPSLHLQADASACTNCGACSEPCPMSLDVPQLVARGSMYDRECVLCGTCADTCPSGAIRFVFARAAKVSTGRTGRLP
jgi:ferredoxin-type protein NapH